MAHPETRDSICHQAGSVWDLYTGVLALAREFQGCQVWFSKTALPCAVATKVLKRGRSEGLGLEMGDCQRSQ